MSDPSGSANAGGAVAPRPPRPSARLAFGAALLASTSLAVPVHAQDDAAPDTVTTGASGARTVPARDVPVPDGVSPEARALIAEPYWLPVWDTRPTSDDEWREWVEASAAAIGPALAELRETLGVSMKPIEIGGVKGHELAPSSMPEANRDRLILNAHGGAYVFGPGESGTLEATLMAAYGGYRVVAFDYRMPPDAPYPAAVDDAVAAWRGALETHDPERLAMLGTSAGGGLVLAAMLRARDEGLALPAAIAPISPWAELTETGDSYRTNEGLDNVLVSYDGFLGAAATLYADGTDLADPGLSPLRGDFAGLPPTILVTGTRDLLLSTTVQVHRKLRRAGVRADLHAFEGFSHAQYLFDPLGPETRELFEEIAAFFDEHLAR